MKLQKGRSQRYDATKFNLDNIELKLKYPHGVLLTKEKLELTKYVPQAHPLFSENVFTS